MSKTNKSFSAQVLTNAQAENHKSDFGEGDILFIANKGIPMPADKVNGADSVDKGKVPKVKADGTWELGTVETGTVVEANPEGDATQDLNKLMVGDVVFGIPQPETNKLPYANTVTKNYSSNLYGSEHTVCYANGQFLFSGNAQYYDLATDINQDNITIERVASPFDTYVGKVVYQNGRFIMFNGSSKVAFSENGKSWTAIQNTSGLSASDNIANIKYINGYYYGFGGEGGSIFKSPDCIVWTRVFNTENLYHYNDIAGNKNVMIAISSDVAGTPSSVYSIDGGNTWQYLSTNTFGNSICYRNGIFVVSAIDSSNSFILYSTDNGTTFVRAKENNVNISETKDSNSTIDYCNGEFVALIGSKLFRSKDGIVWASKSYTLTAQNKPYIIIDGVGIVYNITQTNMSWIPSVSSHLVSVENEFISSNFDPTSGMAMSGIAVDQAIKTIPAVPQPAIANANKTVAVNNSGKYELKTVEQMLNISASDVRKFLTVDEDGNIITTSFNTWNGGNY